MGDESLTTQTVSYPELPGRIGPCRPRKVLGGGAFGTVYLAEMAEDRPYAAAGERVAVKLLLSERVTGDSALKRFQREAELGRSVEHPCVVHNFDVGVETVSGVARHYLVMEYVEGRTLRTFMDELGIVPEALLRALAAQFAEALRAIHDRGAVHRDLKPTNILITQDYRVKLTDLGIALVLEDSVRLTQTGQFVGTLAYSAPEQIRGETVTAAADLYALGVVLYEAATGVQPFLGGGMRAVIDRHLRQDVRKAGQINPQVTPFLEEVISCLLEKRPADRFASAADLAGVLELGESSPWWIARERELRSARPAGILRRIRVRRDTKFVGRDAEMLELWRLADEAARGNGRLLLLEGEAGVGKSRLLDEFLGSIEDAGLERHLLYAAESPSARGPRDAIARAIVDHLGEADLETRLATYLTPTPQLVAGFAAFLTGLPAPRGAMDISREAIPTLLAHLVRGLSRERPVIWIVEDLHFASPESLALFLSLARSGRELDLLLIATFRPQSNNEIVVEAGRLDNASRITVGRLGEDQVLEMLGDSVGTGPRIRDLCRRIAVKADGNPFFVAEMVRELKERQPGATTLIDAASSQSWVERIAVPSAVRDLFGLRLGDLEAESRALLDVAAVAGFEFDPDLVARVRERNRIEVLERFAELERRQGVVRATGAGFQFEHHLMQELIYGAIPPMLLREYHAALATAFERRERLDENELEALDGEPAVFVAEHALKGSRPAAAKRYLLTALDHVASRYETAKLLELAELALQCDEVGGDRELRCDVRLRQADGLFLLGRREEELAAAGDASEISRALSDAAREARARFIQGRALVDSGREAVRILEDALELARSAGDRRTEAAIVGQLGHAWLRGGQFDEARSLYEAQIEGARAAGDAEGEAEGSYNLGESYLGLRRFEEARGHLERSVERFRASRFLRGEARAQADLALAFIFLGDLARARANFEQSIAHSRGIGFLEGEALALANLSGLALLEGSLDEARQLLDSWRACNQALGSPFIDAYWALHSGDWARAAGRPDDSVRLYEDAHGRFRDLEAHYGLADTSLALGRVLLDQGERAGALARFREAQELIERHSLVDPAPLPAAYLALLGEGDANAIAVPETMQIGQKAEAHLVLHRAGASADHLAACTEILQRISRHLEGAALERFFRDNPVAAEARRQAGN